MRGSGLLATSPRFHRAPAAPAAAHRQASRGPRGPRASKCVTTHFCEVSPHPPLPPPRPHPCFRSAPRPPCLSPRAPNNLRFLRSSRVFKALPCGASPGLLNASRASQANRANSRRTLQTLRKASSPQGIQGGGCLLLHVSTIFEAEIAKSQFRLDEN